MAPAPRPASRGAMRYVLVAGIVAVVGAGFMVRAVVRATDEVPALTGDVRADSAAPVAPTLPPPVSGWTPGGSAAPQPEAAPPAASTWSSTSFPVARPNPYDVPGDPSASMVGIAPRAPRDRASAARKRVFTDDDLLDTRGGGGPAPTPSEPAPSDN